MNTVSDLRNLPRADGKMPVLFIRYGNPMYGIRENEYTRGTQVTAMPKPREGYE